MLELIVLTLFIIIGYSLALARNLYLHRRDKRQQDAADAIAYAACGQQVIKLIQTLGDPYEIEKGASGRELYIWKFPPSRTIPKGSGLLTLTVTIDHDIVTKFKSMRQRQL